MIEQVFLDFSIAKLKQYADRIRVCLDGLTEDTVWSRGRAVENSIGNLCLHLTGNVRQWIVAGIGGAEDARDRDAEFATQGGRRRTDLIANLSQTVEEACGVLSRLTLARLEEPVTIQGYHQTVFEAIYHVVEHFSGHTGQIIFATKALGGEDLGFYAHLKHKSHGERVP